MEELYQEMLLDHSKSKRNRGTLAPPACSLHLHNPLCGDEVTFFISVENGVITEAKFEGNGCFISSASASILADALAGKSLKDVSGIIAKFREVMHGKDLPKELEAAGDFAALEGVKQFPIRVKCAMLPFEAVEKLIQQIGTTS